MHNAPATFYPRKQEVSACLADGEGLGHGLLERLEVMLHVLHDHKDVIQLVSHNHLRSQGSGFTLIPYCKGLLWILNHWTLNHLLDLLNLLKATDGRDAEVDSRFCQIWEIPSIPPMCRRLTKLLCQKEKKKQTYKSHTILHTKAISRNVDLQIHSQQEKYYQAAAKTAILAAASLITSIC